jgi:hypothetical protein
MLGIKTKIMVANQIHCRSMSYNYIKCSREKYKIDLHLKIKRYTCIVSIFKKLSVIGWLNMMFSELEKQLQDLQNSGKSVM